MHSMVLASDDFYGFYLGIDSSNKLKRDVDG